MDFSIESGLKVGQSAWLRVGAWLVIPHENRLLMQGGNALRNKSNQQSLEPKLMNLLLWLAQHANEVQSNEVLLQQVWGGTFYSDNPLHRSIAVLRRALGDNARNPSFIRTIRKRGYQLIANVSSAESTPAPVNTQTHLCNHCAHPALDSSNAAYEPISHQNSMLVRRADHRVFARWVAQGLFHLGDLDNATAYFAAVLRELESLQHTEP